MILRKTSCFIFLEKTFILSPIFLIYAFIFNVPDAKHLVSRLVVLVCIYCLFFYKEQIKDKFKNPKVKAYVVASLLVVFYFSSLSFVRGDSFSLARTLLLILVYFLFTPWVVFNKKTFVYLLLFSAFFNFFCALHEHYILGINRVGSIVNPIPYAFYCGVIILSSLCYSLYHFNDNKLLKLTLNFGALLNMYALLLTEVRGVWIALPIALVFLFYKKMKKNKITFKNASLMMVTVFIVGVSSASLIESRWSGTMQEINRITSGDYGSSIGLRLSIWKNSLQWIENPIFGIGTIKLKQNLNDVVEKKIIHTNLPHLHNQYLQLVIESGILGLSLIIIWLFSSIVYFNKKKMNFYFHPLTVSVLVLFFISSLTDIPLMHTHIVYLLGFSLGINLLHRSSWLE